MDTAVLPHAMLVPGSVFHSRYEVVRCLRSGGMGAIYEVIHLETKRRRALKTMLPELVSDPDLRARFQLEATVAAEVESEHVVEVFDAGVDEASGTPFLVMELLKGEDLAALSAKRGPLPPAEVVELLRQASSALDRMHAVGVVHRDLKPENLFVTQRDNGTPLLKVLDFGIAKLVEHSTRARTTRSVGTPLYMPPEQLRGEGELGPAADLYALSHIAFALLVGEAYWERELKRTGSIFPLLVKVMQGGAMTASARAAECGVTLPTTFDAWFARGTALEPGGRFDTASELVESLAHALLLPHDTATPRTRPVRKDTAAGVSSSRGRSGRAQAWRMPAVAALLAFLLGAFVWSRGSQRLSEQIPSPQHATTAPSSAAASAAPMVPSGRPVDADPPITGPTSSAASVLSVRVPSTGPPRAKSPARGASVTRAPAATDPSDFR
jgi:serine/threonine protein kinase